MKRMMMMMIKGMHEWMNRCLKTHRHTKANQCHKLCMKLWSFVIVKNNNKAINRWWWWWWSSSLSYSSFYILHFILLYLIAYSLFLGKNPWSKWYYKIKYILLGHCTREWVKYSKRATLFLREVTRWVWLRYWSIFVWSRSKERVHQNGDILTHSCLKIFLMSVVWTCHTFENNFGMKHEFTNYLKESCRWSSEEQFFFKYFQNIAFVREISSKLSGGFGCYRHE